MHLITDFGERLHTHAHTHMYEQRVMEMLFQNENDERYFTIGLKQIQQCSTFGTANTLHKCNKT